MATIYGVPTAAVPQGAGTQLQAALEADRAAALAAICAGSPALRSLSLLGWRCLTEAALQPLPTLIQMHTLKLEASDLGLGAAAFSVLRQMPRLRSLSLSCLAVDTSGLATLSRLTALDLTAPDAGAELAPALALLTGLRHLGVRGASKAAWAGFTRLTALTSLTSVSLLRPPQVGLEGIDVLLALLADGGNGSEGGGGSGKTASLRRVKITAWLPGPAPVLELRALSRLECLHLEYKALQIAPAAHVTCLAGLTELQLDIHKLEAQHSDGEVTAFVAAVGRRLTALRRLSLQHLENVVEPALACLSGLTRLTELRLGAAYEFGERALSALLPLTDLRRLSLSHAALTEADVEAVVAPADEDPPVLLPHLTYLSMTNCQMLGGPGLARLAAALSSLHWLVHRGSPHLQRPDLRTILQSGHSLRLLQTSWRPAEPPSTMGANVEFDADVDAGNALKLTAVDELDEHQRQKLQRWVEDRAFCQAWRMHLQPGLPTEGFMQLVQASKAQAAYYAFDAARAVLEAQQQPR